MRQLMIYLWMALLFCSCSTSGPTLFSKSTPHEQYGKKLTEAGLDATALGQAWFRAASQALHQPVSVSLPLVQGGYFSAERPDALGMRFTARRGQQLSVQVEKVPANGFLLYTELWEARAGGSPGLVKAADSTESRFTVDVDEEEVTYILRLQPELLKSGSYNLRISIGPTLGFPVAGQSGRIGSVWGDARDAGARSHEGIDIFAPRLTPAIAAADGRVSRANTNNLGGKVVWFRPEGKNYTLYYAHLDSQLVNGGERLKKGDTLGLIGNTGNARSTPPHLHFGIYASGGAVNPLPFVDQARKEPPRYTADTGRLNRYYRTTRSVEIEEVTLEPNTVVWVSAGGPQEWIAVLPDGRTAAIDKNRLQSVENQLFIRKLSASAELRDAPVATAPVKQRVPAGQTLSVRGYFGGFALVRSGTTEGWLAREAVR